MLTKEQITKFESLAKPLMEWLKEHGTSETVVISRDICQFLNPEITIERQYNFYDDPDNYVEELVLKNVSIEKETSSKTISFRGCLYCANGDCKIRGEMQDECNEKNGFPLFEEFPF